MNKENINVYWAPYYGENLEKDWSYLYQKPEILFSSLVKDKTKGNDNVSFFDAKSNFLGCPAITSKFQNTYVFSNLLKTKYEYNFEEENTIASIIGDTGLNFNLRHAPSLNYGPLFELSYGIIMFADKPLNATFTAPFFHKAGYTNYGSVVPGEFDIGRWFRPYLFEIQMWNKKGEFVLDEEPMFYVSFPGDQNVSMHRFNFTKTLIQYAHAGILANGVFGRGQTLLSRYNRFKAVGMREKILTEIKNNIIDDSL